MANRILIGNKSASASPGTNYGYGMYVSKAALMSLLVVEKIYYLIRLKARGGLLFIMLRAMT